KMFQHEVMTDLVLRLTSDIPAASFDDLHAGQRFSIGSILITRDAAIDFASRYDPQPFHLNDEGGEANPVFNRLSASGWHTAVMMQMLVSEFTKKLGLHGLAGGGVEALRWITPVFPPEELLVDLEFVTVRSSKTKPERGIAVMRVIAMRGGREPVTEFVITGIFAR
ncbi:hypothetical protein K9B33_20155, partial [Sphingobium sp. 3R8]|uniref:MaoC/PaaZ C-terminal domain-containing protein n=1 Tax=Sphingobium sp. 3R8 TaxID=2874921 RepID=UPI001CCD4CA6